MYFKNGYRRENQERNCDKITPDIEKMKAKKE